MALRDLWGRRPDAPPALASALSDLERLIETRPEVADAGGTLAPVLSAAFLAPLTEIIPEFVPEPLHAGWSSGTPALRAVLAPVDGRALNDRARAICDALGTRAAKSLDGSIRRGRVDLLGWWGQSLAGTPETIHEEAEALELDPELALSVLRFSLLPPLSRFSEALARVRPEGLWARGECPNCGSAPVLGESRGLEQRRYLRCGLCAGEWSADRLRCPFCGESDHRPLHVRYVEGEQEHRRLALCDTCGNGLKVISTLGPLSAPGLLVAELASAHLDFLGEP